MRAIAPGRLAARARGGRLLNAALGHLQKAKAANAVAALAARSHTTSAFRPLFANRWLWAAIGLSTLLQVAVVHLAFLNVASTAPLDLRQWTLCVAMASVVLWTSELRKLVGRAWRRSRQRADCANPISEEST